MGGVDGDDAAVDGADAVTALPAGEPERLRDAGAGAGRVRPGGEVGEGFAGDLLGRVAEEFLGVLVPGGDVAGAVDLDDRHADSAVGEGEEVGGEGRAGRARAHGPGGEVELEPDGLVGGGVLDAPAAGQGRAQLEPAAALPVGAAHVDGGGLERDLAFGIAVGHLDAYALVAAQAEQIGRGAGVDDGVGHQFAGENDGVVDDVGEAPALEGVADEGAGARDRSPDGLETGGRARGDHRTPRPVLDVVGCVADRLAPLLRHAARRPGVRGLFPRDQSGGHVCGRPSDARSSSCHRPGRTNRRGWTAGCKVTYLRGPCGCRSAVIPPGGCADDVRSCRTVMAWFGQGETLGKLPVKVRAG